MSTDRDYVQGLEATLADLITELRHRGFWLYRRGCNDDPVLLAMVRLGWPRD